MHILVWILPRYFCKKATDMLTREQILEIDRYCSEHKVTLDRYFEKHNVSRHQYFVWKRKYRQEDEQGPMAGAFVQLRPGGESVSPMMPPAKTSGRAKAAKAQVAESYLTVEIRTPSGNGRRSPIQSSGTSRGGWTPLRTTSPRSRVWPRRWSTHTHCCHA